MRQAIVYPPELVQRLFDAIASFESEAATPVAAPSPDELRAVLDAAWSATLLEEEGRRTDFTLGLVSEEEALGTRYRVLPFAAAVPCSAPTIAKLSLATDPRETVL